MYQTKDKKYAIIAISYFGVIMAGYFMMGVMYKNAIYNYSVIQWILWGVAIFLAIINDRNINNLGFAKEKAKRNLLVAGATVVISVCFALLYSDISVLKIFKAVAYYLFYIALFEEMVFRGFIQNYLFGIRANRNIIYIIGALFFAMMHLPFQMYVNNMVSFSYIIVAAPQLVFSFLFHLLMCFITYKSKDILIPTALHFAIDFVQAVI